MPNDKIEKKEKTPDTSVGKDERPEQLKSSDITKPTNKKIYKKPWFWILLVLGLFGLVAIVFAIIFFTAQNKNKQVVSQNWHDLVRESNDVLLLSEKVTDKNTYTQFSEKLHKLDNLINDKQYSTQRLNFKQSDVQRFLNFLSAFDRYISETASKSNKINDYSQEENEDLANLGRAAKESASDFKNNTHYITEDINNGIFSIQDSLLKYFEQILSAEAEAKAKLQQEAAQTAKDAADKKTVEANVSSWLNAFIAGNESGMRRYMTQAFQNEYDFNQVKPEARTYIYPASFRIITSQKNTDGTYKIQANVLYRYRDVSRQYTVGNEFGIIYVNSAGTWLINNLKESSAF